MCIKVNTLKIENNKLYGTIKWVRNYTDVKIVFDGLPREDLSLIFKYEFINDIALHIKMFCPRCLRRIDIVACALPDKLTLIVCDIVRVMTSRRSIRRNKYHAKLATFLLKMGFMGDVIGITGQTREI